MSDTDDTDDVTAKYPAQRMFGRRNANILELLLRVLLGFSITTLVGILAYTGWRTIAGLNEITGHPAATFALVTTVVVVSYLVGTAAVRAQE